MITGEARMHEARILAKEGYSQRDIGERLGVTDRMVRYYLSPKERATRKKRTSLLDPFMDFIRSILEATPYYNLELLRPRLERMGYKGGMTILRECAKKLRDEIVAKAVIRFETEPGFQAQVDWKHAGDWVIDGVTRKVYAFVMLLGFSRRAFVRFTTDMKSATLLACHLEAFAYFGGVPAEILYDNMKTAWLNEGGVWITHPALRAFAAECSFSPKRCQVRRPETKGKVERFIGYLGNNFLPMARDEAVESLDDLNEAVAVWLDKVDAEPVRAFCETRSERFEREKACLRPFVAEAAPNVRSTTVACVARDGTVRYETNSYSMPARYIGNHVEIRRHPFERLATFVAPDGFTREIMLLRPGEHRTVSFDADRRELFALWARQRRRESTHHARMGKKTIIEPAIVEVRSPEYYERFATAVQS